MGHVSWYETALAAVGDGFCPEHKVPLEADGWCGTCRVWWSIGHEPDPEIGGPVVTASYPDAVTGLRPA